MNFETKQIDLKEHIQNLPDNIRKFSYTSESVKHQSRLKLDKVRVEIIGTMIWEDVRKIIIIFSKVNPTKINLILSEQNTVHNLLEIFCSNKTTLLKCSPTLLISSEILI